MQSLYPLRFDPIYRRYLWGGRRLATELGKPIGQEDCAESWEVVDHGEDQSVVREGPLSGVALNQLVQDYGEQFLGRHFPLDSFPLLFKFLDARKDLSLQVHPNDAQAALLDPPDLGKTEAWVILGNEPGAKLYAGLKEGVDLAMAKQAIADGQLQELLHRFEPQVGDCIFLPAGVVHAIGAGLLVAEIQQASDTTYRLFDWNRVGPDGEPRELHVDAGLTVTDFGYGPVRPQTPQPTDKPHISRLVSCEKFVLDEWQFDTPVRAGGDDRFHILAVLDGQLELATEWPKEPLTKGEVVLLPASLGEIELSPSKNTRLLDMYLP